MAALLKGRLILYQKTRFLEHYTRDCEFGNFDKIKNKNNSKTKQKQHKKQKFLAEFLFK